MVGQVKINISSKSNDKYIPRNEIYVTKEWLEENQLHPYIRVRILHGQRKEEGMLLVRDSDALQQDEAIITNRLRNRLKTSGEVSTLTVEAYDFTPVIRAVAKLDEVNSDGCVRMSQNLYDQMGDQIEVINVETGYRRFYQGKGHVKGKNDRISLTRMDTLMLRSNNEKDLTKSNLVIQKVKYEPSLSRTYLKLWGKTSNFLKKFFVGYRVVDLRVGYVYAYDENYDVARIHPEAAKLIGVHEGDKLFVYYNNQVANVTVLYMNEETADDIFKPDQLENERLGNEKNFHRYVAIGLNAKTKHELQIPNPGTIVQVQRNTQFLFLKHLNVLILPILALIFTYIQLSAKIDTTLKIVAAIAILFVIIFTSLSEERSRVK